MNADDEIGIDDLLDDINWVQDPPTVYHWIPMATNGYSKYAPFDEARIDIENMRGNIEVLANRLERALSRIHQSKANDEFCREARVILDIVKKRSP